MLVLLTSKWRQRAAAFMVVLFALCLLSPVAAFAFSGAPAHCLALGEAPQAASESHHHHASGHADHAAKAHQHVDHGTQATADSNDAAVPAKCCGLFCVSGLTPPAFGVSDTRLIATTEVALPVTTSLLGRTTGGIDRPPRSLLSL